MPDPSADAGAFPPVSELLPHRGRSLLVDAVLSHDAAATVCRVHVDASVLYRSEDGSIPAWVGLEYMAQTIAAHGGLLDRSAGRPPRPGLFLGSRRLAFATSRFEAGSVLEVSARHLRGGADGRNGLLAFDCQVRLAGRDDVLVSGVLNVYLAGDFDALLQGFGDGSGPSGEGNDGDV